MISSTRLLSEPQHHTDCMPSPSALGWILSCSMSHVHVRCHLGRLVSLTNVLMICFGRTRNPLLKKRSSPFIENQLRVYIRFHAHQSYVHPCLAWADPSLLSTSKQSPSLRHPIQVLSLSAKPFWRLLSLLHLRLLVQFRNPEEGVNSNSNHVHSIRNKGKYVSEKRSRGHWRDNH